MSTTNDEQAKYGEQPKEWEPMFHRVEMLRMVWREDPAFFDDNPTPEEAYKRAVDECNGAVERLITSGKLRVVEEVELDDTIPGMRMCKTCETDMDDSFWEGLQYCPMCGNKIKR